MFLSSFTSLHTVVGSGCGLVSAAFHHTNLRSLSTAVKFSQVSKSWEQREDSSGVCFTLGSEDRVSGAHSALLSQKHCNYIKCTWSPPFPDHERTFRVSVICGHFTLQHHSCWFRDTLKTAGGDIRVFSYWEQQLTYHQAWLENIRIRFF